MKAVDVSHPATIAIVDDDDSIREALDDLVRSSGYRSMLFSSAEDFLDRRYISAIACMLLDVKMPGLSGLQLQDRLNAEPPKPPVIFFSSSEDDATKRAAIEGGAVAFLRKPVDASSLLDLIEVTLRG